jgi:hypothetical protein
MEKIKAAGTAGLAAYALTEVFANLESWFDWTIVVSCSFGTVIQFFFMCGRGVSHS